MNPEIYLSPKKTLFTGFSMTETAKNYLFFCSIYIWITFSLSQVLLLYLLLQKDKKSYLCSFFIENSAQQPGNPLWPEGWDICIPLRTSIVSYPSFLLGDKFFKKYIFSKNLLPGRERGQIDRHLPGETRS